jgi:hypothetical protein
VARKSLQDRHFFKCSADTRALASAPFSFLMCPKSVRPAWSPHRLGTGSHALSRVLRDKGVTAFQRLVVRPAIGEERGPLADCRRTCFHDDRPPATADFKGRDARRASPGSRRDAPNRPPAAGASSWSSPTGST